MFLFDQRDRQLLHIVNEVLRKDPTRQYHREMVYPYLHPRGIKELSESKGLRIAFAVIHLLESMEAGGVDDRLNALRSLRDEVLLTAAGPLPKNTARVLLQIMKELVRAHGNEQRQLELAMRVREPPHHSKTTSTVSPPGNAGRVEPALLRRPCP